MGLAERKAARVAVWERGIVSNRVALSLSGEMALRIEKAFGVSMDTLMHMLSSCDIAQTRKREKQSSVPRISSLAATQLFKPASPPL